MSDQIEQRIQAIIDKTTSTANEIATRAVGRVIEERDKTVEKWNVVKKNTIEVSEELAVYVGKFNQFRKEHEKLEMDLRGLRDDIAYLREEVRGLTSDAEKAGEVIGKVVALKSGPGGLLMTAAAVTEGGLIQCFWINAADSSLYSQDIPLAALEVVSDKQTDQ